MGNPNPNLITLSLPSFHPCATPPPGSVILFDARLLHAGGANTGARTRRACLNLYVRHWLKPQHDLKRSIGTDQLDQILHEPNSDTMLRLLGFYRQSAIEMADGEAALVGTPGLPVGGFYGGFLADGDSTQRLPPRAGQPGARSSKL